MSKLFNINKLQLSFTDILELIVIIVAQQKNTEPSDIDYLD